MNMVAMVIVHSLYMCTHNSRHLRTIQHDMPVEVMDACVCTYVHIETNHSITRTMLMTLCQIPLRGIN